MYVLGAGFCAEAGMPMMPAFLRTARDAAVWRGGQRRAREARAVDKLLDFREQATRATFRAPIDVNNRLYSSAWPRHPVTVSLKPS